MKQNTARNSRSPPAREQTESSDDDSDSCCNMSNNEEEQKSPVSREPNNNLKDEKEEKLKSIDQEAASLLASLAHHHHPSVVVGDSTTMSSSDPQPTFGSELTRVTSNHESYGTENSPEEAVPSSTAVSWDKTIDNIPPDPEEGTRTSVTAGTTTSTTGSNNNSKNLPKASSSFDKSQEPQQHQHENKTSIAMSDAGDCSVAQSVDPDGYCPSHRRAQGSRRFDDDSMLGNELLLVDPDASGLEDSGEEDDDDDDEGWARSAMSPAEPPVEERDCRLIQGLEEKKLDPTSPMESPEILETPETPTRVHELQHSQQQHEEVVNLQHQGSNNNNNDPVELRHKPSTPLPQEQSPEVEEQHIRESDLSVLSAQSFASEYNRNSRIVPSLEPRGGSGGALVYHHTASAPMVVPQLHRAMHTLAVPPAPAPANGYHHHALHAAGFVPAIAREMPPPSTVMMSSSHHQQQQQGGGKRKIHLQLIEDVTSPKRSSFLNFRRNSNKSLLLTPSLRRVHEEGPQAVDRGRVTVSWYEGTTSLELYEHVRNSVIRKLDLRGTLTLGDFRVLDESTDPPEEIVLNPCIPSGSRLLLRFTTRDKGGDETPMGQRPAYTGGAPDSPSAAPSPHPTAVDFEGLGLNPHQLALLGARLKSLQMPTADGPDPSMSSTSLNKKNRPVGSRKTPSARDSERAGSPKSESTSKVQSPDRVGSPESSSKGKPSSIKDKSSPSSKDKTAEKTIPPSSSTTNKDDDDNDSRDSTVEMQSLHPEDRIQRSLQNITELLLAERQQKLRHVPKKQEKRQVIFVLANYFVLFLSLIAISAEIQARAPGWNAAIEQYLTNVQNCSKDQDALFECVSNGDMAGLVASVILWVSRSAATKRIFLFGFDSPRKLWTVVYESLVTAVCWGFSYIFIRRGMNPDTHRNFLQKYWKDAVYGSLAGFNAAFMKHVLKNLIPQEAIEDALQERQLKILSWLPSFA